MMARSSCAGRESLFAPPSPASSPGRKRPPNHRRALLKTFNACSRELAPCHSPAAQPIPISADCPRQEKQTHSPDEQHRPQTSYSLTLTSPQPRGLCLRAPGPMATQTKPAVRFRDKTRGGFFQIHPAIAQWLTVFDVFFGANRCLRFSPSPSFGRSMQMATSALIPGCLTPMKPGKGPSGFQQLSFPAVSLYQFDQPFFRPRFLAWCCKHLPGIIVWPFYGVRWMPTRP